MPKFGELTYLQQIQRFRELAQRALQAYGMQGAHFRLIAHFENTTFRVDLPPDIPQPLTATDKAGGEGSFGDDSPYYPRRFLLRIHGANYQTSASVLSELEWLTALRREADLSVPLPVPTRSGKLICELESEELGERFVCSLLRWLQGRFYGKDRQDSHFVRLGELAGRLHKHSCQWTPPEGFIRLRWDIDGLFGKESGGFGDVSGGWAGLSAEQQVLFKEVKERTLKAMRDLGEGEEAFGLIHGDLHLGNILFVRGEARPIDFDDCGYSHYIYEFSVLLHEYLGLPDWKRYRDLMLKGYFRHRSLVDRQLSHLETFMAGRILGMVLWAIVKAKTYPNFRSWLDDYVSDSAKKVKDFLLAQP